MMKKHIARLALLGLALALPACGTAIAALIDEVNKAIEDDGNGNLVDVAGVGVVAIDLSTGDREVISDADIGAGTVIVDPRELAFDQAGARCYVWDAGRGAVIAVNALTGDRTLVASSTRGTGSALTSVRALAFDAARSRLLAADTRTTGTVLVAIDPVSGNRSTISGSGTALELPRAMVVGGDTVFVGDASLRAIVAVDLLTGDRRILSDSAHGQGLLFVGPNSLALMGSDLLVLDTSLRLLFSVDVATGDRTTVSGVGSGFGSSLVEPVGLAFNPGTWEALVLEQTPAPVFLLDVDPLTGDRGVVASPAVGAGPGLTYPVGVALDSSRGRVLVLHRTTP